MFCIDTSVIPIPHKAVRLFRIQVEYDCRGGRACKLFTDQFAARRFCVAKFKAGKRPHLRRPKPSDSNTPEITTMATTTKKAPKQSSTKKADAKASKPAAKEATGPAGVRPAKNRSYCAALVINKHGLKAGVTEAMVKEVEALYGEPAPAGGIGWMTAAWHALNAWSGEFDVDAAE